MAEKDKLNVIVAGPVSQHTRSEIDNMKHALSKDYDVTEYNTADDTAFRAIDDESSIKVLIDDPIADLLFPT